MATPHQDDPFDTLLTLEDTLYTTAYTQGVTDGATAGRIEGRIFGLEKGFDKFTELGHLHGRSVVWAARLPSLQLHQQSQNQPPIQTQHQNQNQHEPQNQPHHQPQSQDPTPPSLTTSLSLPPFPTPTSTPRLQTNITLTHALTDPLTFSTSNTEESVADFDDRFKRAGAKAKVIERIVGESTAGTTTESSEKSPARTGKSGPVRVAGDGKRGKKGDDSMEDFMGSRLIG